MKREGLFLQGTINLSVWRGCEKFQSLRPRSSRASSPASRRSTSPPLSLTDLKLPPPTNSPHVLVEGRVRFPQRHQPAIRIRPTSWFKESRGQDFLMMTWLLPTGLSRGLRQHIRRSIIRSKLEALAKIRGLNN